MKGFVRNNQYLSLCGLNCKLCPMNLAGHCSGCGVDNQSCKIIYMSVFVTREAGTLKAIFDFPMFNTALCDFTTLIINAATGTMPCQIIGFPLVTL